MDAWWRAANYLNVGQIYLSANPLLRQKLTVEHIKPRLLGHCGTALITYCSQLLEAHERYIREHFDDLPEIKNWVWSAATA